MADVELQFKAALDVIQNLPKSGSYKPSPDMMLQFYSLYKQATEGRCNRAKPWSFDIINKAKWDAWNKLGDMPKEEAMKSYVKELTKVMKEFPRPTEKQIIEALPASDKAASFIKTLGQFYEIVDPSSENAKEFKAFTDAGNMNGNGQAPLDRNVESDQIATSHVNGGAMPERNGLLELQNRSSESESDAAVEKEADTSGEETDRAEVVVSDRSRQPSEDEASRNESDDEFCDTTADISFVQERKRDDSGSQSTSTLSSTSLNHSPSSRDLALDSSLGVGGQPRSRGGQQGTHGVDESLHLDRSQTEQTPASSSAPIHSASLRTHSQQSTSGGGSGGDRNPLDGRRHSEVQERIAVALLQLQRDMHSVLNRLTTLETITISRNQDLQHCHHCCVRGGEGRPSWWPFDELSPKTTLFILLWPFLARLLFAVWSRSRRRR